MEWWRDDRGNKLTRDYFRVESDAGARVWLYREGLYGREAARNPRWYLQGCLRECEVMSAYAELAVTTNFSFLRGASTAEELVLRAKELGLVGIGIADRNSVAGVVRAHAMAKVIGFKIAVGARLVFSDGSPDILAYPEDRAAWGRLTRLLTVGKDRAEKGDCILGLPDLLEESKASISSSCRRARIDADALVKLLRRFKEASRRSVWLAASLLYRGDDRRRLAKLRDIAEARSFR